MLSKATNWMLRLQFLTRGRICILPSHSEWICWHLNLLSSRVKQLQCIADHSYLWHYQKLNKFIYYIHTYMGTAVVQWLRCCATNWKVGGSILAGVSGFFIDIKSFQSYYGPGVDSASNRNEYQEYV